MNVTFLEPYINIELNSSEDSGTIEEVTMTIYDFMTLCHAGRAKNTSFFDNIIHTFGQDIAEEPIEYH